MRDWQALRGWNTQAEGRMQGRALAILALEHETLQNLTANLNLLQNQRANPESTLTTRNDTTFRGAMMQ